MSDLRVLQYIQLTIFTAFIITFILLVINLIKEKQNKND